MDWEPIGLLFDKPGVGYASQDALLGDFCALLDQRLAWLASLESEGPFSWQGLDEARLKELSMSDAYLESRLADTADEAAALCRLFRRLPISNFEARCVMLCLAALLDTKYRALFAALQDGQERPTAWLAARLFAPAGAGLYQYAAKAAPQGTPYRLFQAAENGCLLLDAGITAYLMGQPLSPGAELTLHLPAPLEDAPVRREYVALLKLWLSPGAGGMPRLIALNAPAGGGKRYLVKQALFQMGRPMLELDGYSLCAGVTECMRRAYTQARLSGGTLCISHFEALLQEGTEGLRAFSGVLKGMKDLGAVLVLSEIPWRDADITADYLVEEVALPELDQNERLALFRYAGRGLPLAPEASFSELAAKFRFWPGQIINAMLQARERSTMLGEPANPALLHHCCYTQAVHQLDALATPVTPAYSWDDLVLPAQELRILQQACRHVQYQHKVFFEWGFNQRISYGKGVSMMFAGPPGTGKTMAAQVVANQLHMQLYQIQLSQVVSKYIGETEKNLRALFREARNSSCILFFDECDALFGKRGEVKDSNDRYANVEVAYLLQQVEAHEGVSILATNLLQNIDTAFMRRISFVAHFPFPDQAMRRQLFEKMLPRDTPREPDIDFDFLAEKFNVTGGSIKNIVLHAAFEAAASNVPLGMVHLLRAGVAEFRKNDIIIVREDMREYADLVF